MSHFYLAPYVGTGTVTDPFTPRGSEQPGWSAIDIRPNGAVISGRALIAVPTADATIGEYLGDDPDGVSIAVRNLVQSRLGLTLAATRLRPILAELLMAHGREDGTRWRNLKPSRRRKRYEIYLDHQLFWSQPIVAGGVTYTESFTTGDSDTLGPDLTWTEIRGDIDIVGNLAQSVGTATDHIARADHDLSSADHYAQAVVGASEETDTAAPSVMVRKDATADRTFYHSYLNFQINSVDQRKQISGADSNIANTVFVSNAGTTYLLRLEVDGDTLETFVDTISRLGPTTDTSITTGLRTGLRGFKATSGFLTWDSFEAGDLGVVAPDAGGSYSVTYARPRLRAW